MSRKTILVTGCSAGGIGAALALALAYQGHHVFATARLPAKIPASLSELSNVTTLAMDVTSVDSVAAAVRAVEQQQQREHQQNPPGLDILINNAGMGYTAPLLDSDLDEAVRLYDINVWGPLRTIQAFASLLIARRGRIVNISSISAAVGTPWIGIYSSSKSALTNLSETLRLELAPFGVSVMTVMAGLVATSFHKNKPVFVLPPSSRYEAIRSTIATWASGEAVPENLECSPDHFARIIVDDILRPGKGGMLWRGPNSLLCRLLPTFLPASMMDHLNSYHQGLGELAKSLNDMSI